MSRSYIRRTLVVLVVAVTTEAGTAEGLAALKSKDYRKAKEEFTAAGEAGDAEAQFQLGDLYLKGRGVEKNPRMAAQWYEMAIAQGNKDAQGRLGTLLWQGSGISKNRDRALELLRDGVAGGSAIARYELGLLDWKGEKVGLAADECYELFRKAGEQGHADAQAKYGDALLHGRIGGKEDPAGAEEWLQKAALQGHVEAMRDLGFLVTKTKGHSEGLEWFRKAALRGDATSQVNAGLSLLIRKSEPEGYAWCLVASDLGNSLPKEFEPSESLRKKQSAHAKEMVKKLGESLDAKTIKEGKALAREYIKTIRTSLKEGQAD